MTYRTFTRIETFPSSRSKDGLKFVGKCYVPQQSNAEGLTLVFFHCAGSHKEVWETVILHLLALKGKGGKLLVREAWTFDMQSHGEAAKYNKQILKNAELTVNEWMDGFRAFVKLGVFDGHQVVPIAHSLGATLVLLSLMPGPEPPMKYKYVVLVEPSLITQESWQAHMEDRQGALKFLTKATMKRRDAWNSREEAKGYFEPRLPWNTWDSRILDIYVRYGLEDVEENGVKTGNVVLATPKAQESAAFVNIEPHFVVVEFLKTLDRSLPIHFVLGTHHDVMPDYTHQGVMDVRPPASVQRVPDAAHFVVQQNPDGVAYALTQILTGAAWPRAAL